MKKIIVLLLAISMLAVFAVGCSPSKDSSKEPNKVVDLKDIHNAVKQELGDEYIPNSEIDAATLEAIYGVKASDVEEFIAESPMISVNVDNFIAVKAKEGKADAVEESLKAYRQYVLDNAMQYPMNIAKVNASEVVRHGDYVFFLLLGRYDNRDDATEEEALEFAQEETKKIKEVIAKFFN